jgi:hypothetical protein
LEPGTPNEGCFRHPSWIQRDVIVFASPARLCSAQYSGLKPGTPNDARFWHPAWVQRLFEDSGDIARGTPPVRGTASVGHVQGAEATTCVSPPSLLDSADGTGSMLANSARSPGFKYDNLSAKKEELGLGLLQAGSLRPLRDLLGRGGCPPFDAPAQLGTFCRGELASEPVICTMQWPGARNTK